MNPTLYKRSFWLLAGVLTGTSLVLMPPLSADIAATHVYHNHMPNFWPYYDLSQYDGLSVGSPVRYAYDGYVIELKESPPFNYTYYLPDGQVMPHDDLVSYYSHHAKTGAYMTWPWDTATQNDYSHPQSQTQVTMSGSVVNNVQSLNELQNVEGYYNTSWGYDWRRVYDSVTTTHGFRSLELIHFSGHHALGPLVGRDFLLKDMIFHGATLSQPYFLGDSYRSSKGFFPTELGFSERIIPTLKKLGIEWSVLANVHLSRTLRDYPYLNDPGIDTLVSPPNRADLQNESNIGIWVSEQMFNEQQVTHNKFPFASIPHWVRYVDPETGEEMRIAGIPVEQASSWEEGYQGSITADLIKPFEDDAASLGRVQYFVIAHDGDNSSGRAGDGGTWLSSGLVTYSDAGVTGKGVQEYLLEHPIPELDLVHVQDGSWIDTRDSSADPTWYHWHLPMGIWEEQFADFNAVHGTSYTPKKNLSGEEEGMTVSLEYGYHYLERNYALLQAAENYARTAEQIWLDAHPNHWQPSSSADQQITFSGNQLNPWMYSFPVKGDPANDYQGGANPAELAWYFLLPAMDSGFGYYDENVDDNVKPTLAFNGSLYFSVPYVDASLSKDETGPNVWWPQRYPYNPGSANKSKAEGWTLHYFDNNFAIYTYAFDVNGIADIQLKVRVHAEKTIDATDKTCRVYDPSALEADPQIDPSNVGPWVSYDMRRRELTPDMNGVDWQPSGQETMAILPAQKIGDLYYTYLGDYRDEILDYYIEAVDSRGNVTKSDIQQVYVGMGRYRQGSDGKIYEDANGTIEGTYPFVTDEPPTNPVTVYLEGSTPELVSITLESRPAGTSSWSDSTTLSPLEGDDRYFKASLAYTTDYDGIEIRYTEDGITWKPSSSGTLLTTGTWTIYADGGVEEGLPEGLELSARIYYASSYGDATRMHWAPDGGAWTAVPGELMARSEYDDYYVLEVDLGTAEGLQAVFTDGNGTWDNNGGANYHFDAGVSTLEAGNITVGPPPETPGNVPPVADAGEDVYVLVGDTVQLDGSGSYDSDGSIEVYEWSNGLTGIMPTTTYTESGTYTVTLTVTDDGGASDTDTLTVYVHSPDDNLVTVYYKRGYSTPYIHYKQANGVWTTVPGVAMPDSEFEGYNVAEELNIGSDTQLECVFTDGKGNWDNNGGKNYFFDVGTWTYDAGTITAGAPEAANEAPMAVLTPDYQETTVGQAVTLSGVDSYDPDGQILTYLWSTGATTIDTVVLYETAGTFEVTLTVTDEDGAMATTTATVVVVEEATGCGTGARHTSMPRGASGLGIVSLLPLSALLQRRRRVRENSVAQGTLSLL